MRVRVTKSFRHRGQLLTEGTILTVQAQHFPRLAHLVDPLNLDDMEDAYFALLAKYWTIDDDPAITPEQASWLVDRMDRMYQELHRQGRSVPVRLPTERQDRTTSERKAAR